jgi:hypothetical protein
MFLEVQQANLINLRDQLHALSAIPSPTCVWESSAITWDSESSHGRKDIVSSFWFCLVHHSKKWGRRRETGRLGERASIVPFNHAVPRDSHMFLDATDLRLCRRPSPPLPRR